MTTPNTTCLYPQFAVSTASNKGCRCERCSSYTRNRRKAWYSKNAEYAKVYCKNNRNKLQWRLQTPSNAIKDNINSARYRMLRMGKHLVPPLNPDEQARLYKFYETRYYLTESTGVIHHVDHIIPGSKGGQHHPDNLQVLTAAENIKKRDKIL